MRYVIIENFKYGLDSRRLALTSQPGTLVTLENAHVTPGGEIEKRKAFVDMKKAGSATASLTGTFGLEATEDGLIVFGDTPVGIVGGFSTANLPTGVSYLAVLHPYVYVNGWYGTLNAAHKITEIVFSCNYDGKPFVAAKFGDGNTYLYYGSAVPSLVANGTVAVATLVMQSCSGIVFPNSSGTALTTSDLATLLESSWEALGTDWTATTTDGNVSVQSKAGVHFEPVVVYTTAGDGMLQTALQGYDSLGSVTGASIVFTVTAKTALVNVLIGASYNPRRTSLASLARSQSGTTFRFYRNAAETLPVAVDDWVYIEHTDFKGPYLYKVTAVSSDEHGSYFEYTVSASANVSYTADTDGTYEFLIPITATPQSYNGSSETTSSIATRMTMQINAACEGLYTAISGNATVQVTANPEWGAWTGVFIIQRTDRAAIGISASGSVVLALRLSPSAAYASGSLVFFGGIYAPKRYSTQNVSAIATGGTVIAELGYTYLWSFVKTNRGDGDNIECDNPSGPITKFTLQATKPGVHEAVWKCKVTDNATDTASVSKEIKITFTIGSVS